MFIKSIKYHLKQKMSLYNKEIADALVEMKLCEEVSPDAVVGQRQLTANSTQNVLAKELVPALKTKIETLQAKIRIIKGLI